MASKASNNLLPTALRQLYRSGKHFNESSYGLCPGYLQTNMVMIPSIYSDDFERFCLNNASSCPLISKSSIGETKVSHLAADYDIR